MRSWKRPSWTSPACMSLRESPRPPVESYSLSRGTITTKSILDYYALGLHALGFHYNQARRIHDSYHMPVVPDFVYLNLQLVYTRAASRYRIAPLSFALHRSHGNTHEKDNPQTNLPRRPRPIPAPSRARTRRSAPHSILTPAKLAHHGASAISSHRTTPAAKTLVHLTPAIPRPQSTAKFWLPVSQKGVTTGGRGGNIQVQRPGPIAPSVHRGSAAGCRSQIATEGEQVAADPVGLSAEESERGCQTTRGRRGRTCSG
ncbi:hypothetical protein BJX96DRAFT_168417 [Aspergillus floccosus]